MDYVGSIIRPPSEAHSMIIQITVGCSHAKCTFCQAYGSPKFYIKDMNTIIKDIKEASRYDYDRVFFSDRDALIMPTDQILKIMKLMRASNPNIERFASYANTKALLKKSVDELKELRDAGMGILYQGIESGNETILRKIKKGALPRHQIEAAAKVKKAGIKLSQTYLLGLGGTEMSREHAVDSGKHLSAMAPDYASALTIMVVPGTELDREIQSGRFRIPGKFDLLNELKLMIEYVDIKEGCFFTSNHASNYVPIRAHLPQQKNEVVQMLDGIINSGDENKLRPEYMRGL